MTDITALLHTFISNPKAQTSEDPKVICRLALAEINRLDNQLSIISKALDAADASDQDRIQAVRKALEDAERMYPEKWALIGKYERGQ